jgi:hypothetical protein
VLAVRLIVPPTQTAPPLPAVGADGIGLTVTLVLPAALVHPFTVTVTLYVPAIAAVALAMVGFCEVLLKLFGPVHEKVAPATVGVERVIVVPAHTGLLLLADGVEGIEFTVTFVVAALLVHPFTVAVTLYVPAIATVAPGIVGFCALLVNPLGPIQE